MEPQVCFMAKVCLYDSSGEGGGVPLAQAIAIAPTLREAEQHARRDIDLIWPDNDSNFGASDLGSIMFPPLPTTIFLHSTRTGRVG